MKLRFFLVVMFCGLSQTVSCNQFNVISDTNSLITNGKKEYELLVQRRETTLYGECWSHAISTMERNCKLLDEYRQSWLATLFTNCFLKASGFDENLLGDKCLKLIDLEYENLLPNELKECTQNIDMKIFHTYSLFYVHTQSICFYLQSEQWQRRTENLVDNLIESSRMVSQDLIGAVGNIEQLKLIQDTSLNTQKSINDQLSRAKLDMEEFHHQSRENRDLLERVIDQFILLRHFILVEFSLNSSIFFYMIAMTVIYFLTTTKRAHGVRLPLYMILVLGFIIEKKWIDFVYRIDRLVSEHVPLVGPSEHDLHMEQFTMSRSLWLVRKTMMSIVGFVYVWWIITYRDIAQISYRMISEHTRILREIQRDIKASPEKYLSLKQAYEGYSEDSESSDIDSSDDTYSDYSESDIEFPEIDQENRKTVPTKYAFRSKIPRLVPKDLPKEFEKESVTDFAHSIKKKNRGEFGNTVTTNFYSSDEDL